MIPKRNKKEKLLRITYNERRLLNQLLKNARATDVELGHKLNISSQATQKIRKRLEEKNLIKRYHTTIDYSLLGLNTLALVMLDVRKTEQKTLQQLQQHLTQHLFTISKVLQGPGKYIALFGFKNIEQQHAYFNTLQHTNPGALRLNTIYTFHIDGYFKNSSEKLYKHLIETLQQPKTLRPPKLEYYNQKKNTKHTKKLSTNELLVLKALANNGRTTLQHITQQTKTLTNRGIANIKERLEKKGIIKGYTLELDYEKLGIGVFAFVFIKKKPAYWKLEDGLSKWAQKAPNIIESYKLNEGSLQALFCAFRNLTELEQYWEQFEEENEEYIEIEHIYISSGKNNLELKNTICPTLQQ